MIETPQGDPNEVLINTLPENQEEEETIEELAEVASSSDEKRQREISKRIQYLPGW